MNKGKNNYGFSMVTQKFTIFEALTSNNMKNLFYIVTILFSSFSAIAQENTQETSPGQEPTLVERLTRGKTTIDHAEMNFQLFTSANANFTDKEFDGMNFKLNRVRLEIKGDVGKYLSYHYRQSFNKYSDPYSLDNLSSSLELAYVNLKVNNK